MRTIITALLILIVSAHGVQAQQPGKINIDKVQALPSPITKMVKAGDNYFFADEGGKFILVGMLYDTATNRQIRNMDELAEASKKPLAVDPAKLDGALQFTFGTGPEVTVFTSPGCPYCKELLAQAAGLRGQYSFRFVPIPLKTDESKDAIRRLACLEDSRKSSGLSALLSDDFKSLPEGECDLSKARRSLALAQEAGVQGVPHVIFGSRSHHGSMSNLKAFLEGK